MPPLPSRPHHPVRPESPEPPAEPTQLSPLGGLFGSTTDPGELELFRSSDCPAEAARLLAQGLVRTVVADVLVAFDVPDNRAVRSAAAMLLLPRTAAASSWVVGFASAAWLHTGAGAGGPDAPTELQVIIPPRQRRPREVGLRARQVALPAQHITSLGSVAVTEPVRTAADVARDLPPDAALAILTRLEEICGVRPHQVLTVLTGMRYARGAATARQVIKRWEEA